MNRYYDDILKLTTEPPTWFDEQTVPRYCKFTPDWLGFTDEAALVEIACQCCQRKFRVAFSRDRFESHKYGATLAESIRAKDLDYGDPPNVDCCASGPTMTTETQRVLEYWRREPFHEWSRDSTLEVTFDEL